MIASLVIGAGLLQESIGIVKAVLISDIEQNSDGVYGAKKEQLLSLLPTINGDDNDVILLTKYLKFSESQMTNEEKRQLVTGRLKKSRIGDSPLPYW